MILFTGPGKNAATYAALKSALDTFTKSAAVENGAVPIRFNSVLTGPTETEMMIPALQQISKEQVEGECFLKDIASIILISTHFKAMLSKSPLKRVAKPEEIAKPVVFLLSNDASYITGATLLVDGGMILG